MNNSSHQFAETIQSPESAALGVRFDRRHVYLLLLAICASYSMLFFMDRVWAPGKSIHFCDLYPRWYGARELLLRGRDPYGPDVTREIQMWSYGHPLEIDRKNSQVQDENRFAYPLYIVFLLAPFVRLSFPQTYYLFRMLVPLVCIATTLLWLRAVRWKCGPLLLTSIVLLSIFNFPMLESIYLQQPVVLAAAFLAGSCVALTSNHLYTSGILLALATIKPQVTALFALWILFWGCSEWRSRKGVVIGFLAAFGLLVGGAELLLPGWISEFTAGLMAYQQYTSTLSILSLAFGRLGGVVLTLFLLIAAGWVAWRTRYGPPGSSRFYFTFSSLLVLTLVIAPTMYPTGQVILLPVVFWIFKDSRQIWSGGRWTRLAYVSTLGLLVWPWSGSLVALAIHRVISLEVLRSAYISVLAPVLLIPLSLLALLATRAVTVL